MRSKGRTGAGASAEGSISAAALVGEKVGPCRGGDVLVRAGDRRLIAQYDLALTVPNARFAAAGER